ncbi:hypothetical protein B0J17DRAFT_721821 [Rhizoctonia solani]|nr:hypothetical protein B0J17DRAFT_721821 [Rhizoctonia solani]
MIILRSRFESRMRKLEIKTQDAADELEGESIILVCGPGRGYGLGMDMCLGNPWRCVDMDWICDVPNPWVEFVQQEEMDSTEMNEVSEEESTEFMDNDYPSEEEPTDAAMDELAEQLAAMWTPAASEAGPAEDSDSDGQETGRRGRARRVGGGTLCCGG